MEFANSVQFYKFEYEKNEFSGIFTNRGVILIFKYLITEPIYVNALNNELSRCKKSTDIITYLNLVIDVGNAIITNEKNIDVKLFHYIDIFNKLVYKILSLAADVPDIDDLLENFDKSIDEKLSNIKTLSILNHESTSNIFTLCKYFFESIHELPSDLSMCIVLFLYFGVPGITPSNILIANQINVNDFIPIILLKLKTHEL